MTDFSIYTDRNSLPIKDGETMAFETMAGLDTTLGRVLPYSPAAGVIPIGEVIEQPDGERESMTGNAAGTTSVVTATNIIQPSRTIVGLTAETQVRDLVYMTSSTIYDMSKPVDGFPVGRLKRFRSAGVGDVQLFTTNEYFNLDLYVLP